MKRNATQSSCSLSSNRCSLCGDYFCLIRTAPTQCNSCRKILCNKCCIDTECTVENDLTCKTLQSRKNSSNNLSVTNGLIGTASNFSKTLYLCRICSEQREVKFGFNKITDINLFLMIVLKEIRCLVSKKIPQLFNGWYKYKIKINFNYQ